MTAQCNQTDKHGRRCALVKGHGKVYLGHGRGEITDGHLYPQHGEDLSNEIRFQSRIDGGYDLHAELQTERALVRELAVCLRDLLNIKPDGEQESLEEALRDGCMPRLVEHLDRCRAALDATDIGPPGCTCHQGVGDSPCPVHPSEDDQ